MIQPSEILVLIVLVASRIDEVQRAPGQIRQRYVGEQLLSLRREAISGMMFPGNGCLVYGSRITFAGSSSEKLPPRIAALAAVPCPVDCLRVRSPSKAKKKNVRFRPL